MPLGILINIHLTGGNKVKKLIVSLIVVMGVAAWGGSGLLHRSAEAAETKGSKKAAPAETKGNTKAAPAKGNTKAEKAPPRDQGLVESDCIKCHMVASEDIEVAGMAHKTAVKCLDCHVGHPPVVFEIIPTCVSCHSGKPHFEINQCLSCHSNPHRPLELQLARNITGPCLTCHADQGTQLKDFPSVHTGLNCTACHQAHRQVPDCLNCHQPHSADMVQADCQMCHQAHKPLVIAYGPSVPAKSCAACHADTAGTVAASQAKHKDVNCVTCHEAQHGRVPQCAQCHQPHSKEMVQADCDMCHRAHAPVPVVYSSSVPTSSCAACHAQTRDTLVGGKTKHQGVLCAACHQPQHGNIPQCANCHQPHAPNMAESECRLCHAAHVPMPVVYGDNVPSHSCGACHDQALKDLAATETKHNQLSCAACHQAQHGMVPTCQDCHGTPHSPRMLAQFPNCADCHGTAHGLIK